MKIPQQIDTKKELEVYLLQHALNAHGFDPKGLDGVRGQRTEAALADAWKAHRSTLTQAPSVPEYAQAAYEHLGLSEVPGAGSNATILGWIKTFFTWATNDGEVAWCAIFINTMLKQAGLKGTGKANARSFLDWGTPVSEPRKGDIVVFWRGNPDSWQGHVGIYWGDAPGDYVYCLGGNQSDKVSIATYPETSVLGYRRATA